MSDKLYSEESIQAIANSIRAKNGTSETYTVSEMSTAISALPTNLTTKTITANGTYNASSDDADGYSSVTVAVEGYAKKSISNTPTPIATFNASALPMPSLSVGIEAVQDLHGYDNPWVGGGGKNKIDAPRQMTLSEAGYVINQQVLKYPISSGTYTASMTCSTAVAWVINLYDASKNKIIGISSNGAIVGRQSKTADLPQTAYYASIYINGASTVSDIQVESGSTATSYAPYSNICPISGFSAVNRYRTNKNMFSPSSISQGTYDSTTNVWTISAPVSLAKAFDFSFKENTQYTFSGTSIQNNASKNVRLVIVYTDDTFTNIWATNSTEPIDFATTSTANKTIKEIQTRYGTSDIVTINNFQIEVGTSASEYVAPNGTTYTTALKDGQGNPMECYGGELSNVNGVQSLNNSSVKTIIDENSSILYRSSGVALVFLPTPYKTVTMGGANIICDKLKSAYYANYDSAQNGEIATVSGSTPQTGITFKISDDITSLEELKTWLASNPLTIITNLATPQTIPQDNLAIATQEGTNNLWADSGDIQSGEYLEAL